MTKYTDDQINEAIMLANQTGKVYAWETEMYRNVIKHLPDQQDEWQQCPMFGEPKPGDRLRIRWACGDVHEGVITSRSRDHIQIASTQVNRRDKARLEYIPAPVQHPYPLDHPAIVVIEADGYEDTNPQAFVWTGNRYENDAWSFDADDITSWKPIDPAKVVSDAEIIHRVEDTDSVGYVFQG